MKSVIYETKGRAREFSELGCNLYAFCSHGCVYCSSPLVLHKNREDFLIGSYPRVTAQDVLKSAWAWKNKGETRRCLFSFICDPYQPIEAKAQLTRKCIMALHEAGLNVIILTKGGLRSMRDFDLLTPNDAFATTLTCLSDKDSLYWEPHAALPAERVKALTEANKRGIETWVSLEPVIYPEDAMQFVRNLHKVVSHFKIGTMNYHPHGKTIDWHQFAESIIALMDSIGVCYYIKSDLAKYLNKSEGFWSYEGDSINTRESNPC